MVNRETDKLEIRLATDADVAALLSFIAEMGFNPRTERTWRGLSMGAMTAWAGGRLIGAVPYEPRILQAASGGVIRALHETVVAVRPEYRASGVGTRMQMVLGNNTQAEFVGSALRTVVPGEREPVGDTDRPNAFTAQTQASAQNPSAHCADPVAAGPNAVLSGFLRPVPGGDGQGVEHRNPTQTGVSPLTLTLSPEYRGGETRGDATKGASEKTSATLPITELARGADLTQTPPSLIPCPTLVTVFREDPTSPAYRWYLKCGFVPTFRIESFFADDPQHLATGSYRLIPPGSPEVEPAAIAFAWEQSHGSASGVISRRHRPIVPWLDIHPYAARYRFVWVISDQGWPEGHALLGVGQMHSSGDRADILQLAGDPEKFVRLAARACADQGWTPLRWPVASSGEEADIAQRLGMCSRWTFDMLCKPIGGASIPHGDGWIYSGLDFA